MRKKFATVVSFLRVVKKFQMFYLGEIFFAPRGGEYSNNFFEQLNLTLFASSEGMLKKEIKSHPMYQD